MKINERQRAGRHKRRMAGISVSIARTSVAFAAVLAVVLWTTAVLLSATGPADAAPRQAAQQADEQAIPVLPDTEAMSNEEFAALLASAEFELYAREDAFADTFSVERAAGFLDRVAVTWGDKFGCVTCHTNGWYLTSPAEIFGERRAFGIAHEQAERFVRSWRANDIPGNDAPNLGPTSVVATSAFLAINEAQAGASELSDITLEGLDRAWSLQDEGGHWVDWVVCNWPPFESDFHFGVTLMAIATGMAPGDYASTDAAVEGMRRIRAHIAANPPEFAHNRAMLLWAGSLHEGLVSEADRDLWVDELLGLQRDDGGWASGDLGVWRMRRGLDSDPPATIETDGYGTGFVVYTLRQAGVPASHPAIRRGVSWLKTHQRADGYWWTQSLRNASDTSNFLTHAGTTFALKAIAATEHDTAGVADVER